MYKIIFSGFILFSSFLTFGQVVGTPYIFNNIKFEFTIREVTSKTGKIWLDRNLGADRVAPRYSGQYGLGSYEAYYGDYYQWGRSSDGHQKYNSSTYTSQATSSNISFSDSWYGKFINYPTPDNYDYNWLNTQNDNLWQGVAGVNNPCPTGYRVPTQAEWFEEAKTWTTTSWTSSRLTQPTDAFNSVLKIPAAGQRTITGALSQIGSDDLYWTSTIWGVRSFIIRLVPSNSIIFEDKCRANGYPIRCIKNY